MQIQYAVLILIIGSLLLYGVQVFWGHNQIIEWITLFMFVVFSTLIRAWVSYKSNSKR